MPDAAPEADKQLWERELQEMLNPEYYQQRKRVDPRYLQFEKAAAATESNYPNRDDPLETKMAQFFASQREKEKAADWNFMHHQLFRDEMDTFLLPYLMRDFQSSFAFKYAPWLKAAVDVGSCLLVSRAIRRAYFVYEYGLIYAFVFGCAFVQIGSRHRDMYVGQQLMKKQLNCDFCAYAKGFSYDLVFTLAIPFCSSFVNTIWQAERFKSAQSPSWSTFKWTKSQRSLWKGILTESLKRGGGLRSAMALAIIPGFFLTKLQISSSERLWNSIPESEKKAIGLRQRANFLSVLHR